MRAFSFAALTSLGASTPVTAPTLSGVAPGRISIFGGAPLIITGTNLSGATAVTLGGTACTLGANTGTSLTVTAPAKAAGTYDLVVTTPGGSATLPASVVVVDPAALVLSAYQLGADYVPGTGAWPATVSAGTSGSLAFAYHAPGGIPGTVATPSGRTVPRPGSGGAGQGFKAGTLGDWMAASAGTLVFAVRVYSGSTDAGASSDGSLFADVAGFTSITARNTGPTARVEFDSAGVASSVAVAGWVILSVRWDQSQTRVQTRVNRGAWSTVTKTYALSLAGAQYLGLNPLTGAWLDVAMGMVLASKAAVSDATLSDMEQAAADYVGVAL